MQIRKHLPAAPVAPAKDLGSVWLGRSTVLANAGEPSIRDLSLEVSDTAEGRIALLHYGRFRVACPITHGDIVSGKLELIAHVGEGPIASIDYVWINEKLVYPGTPPTGVEVELRLGGSLVTGPPESLSYEQAAFTIISNATIKDMQHPGQALVAVRVNLTTAVAIVSGNTPKIEVAGRGLYVQNPMSMDPDYIWTENPILCLSDAMQRTEYGCSIPPYTGTDWSSVAPGGSFGVARTACDQIITYETLAWRGQTSSNQQLLLSDYDRLQSFKAPARGFKIEVNIRAVATTGINIAFPCMLRTSPDGADIAADLVSTPVTPVAGTDYTMWGLWYDTHGIEKDQLVYLIALKTGWQASNMKWHHNSLTNEYADGKSQKKNGSWADVNYDHWFRAYEAEQMFRCELTISERTPIEQVAETLLRTCNGRLGWWDGLYRVFLDGEASVAGTISDKATDAPDLLIVGGTLRAGRSEAEIPNVGVGTYFDVQTWTRPEVKYQSDAVKAGAEQEKILRQDIAVPSGGQLYRLLGTQIKRDERTWRASCTVAQKGIRFAPGDVLTMSCSLFTGTKTVIIDDMRDAPGGTFELSLLEWAASDFLEEPYIAQAVVATTTTT